MRALSLYFISLLLLSCSNEYFVKAYKTESEIRRGDQVELLSRFSTIEFKDLYLHLEWYTYDNFIINRPPYKLLVVSEPKSSDFERIEIVDVALSSSLGREYSIDSGVLPVTLKNENMGRDSHTFEPALSFRFGKKEKISSIIKLIIFTKNGVLEKELNLRWEPVEVKHYAPIV
ncbi:hypothetical protein SAMN02745866_04288 [Alteromonadaceae bacterium Bs31]|nr:hypothetical protein SAMN02745866_04288 [Alteromonadaceae bacterium Bs31]